MQQFLRDTVGPRIVQRSREDMEEALAEIDQLFAAFDAAHSSVRDAEQSTAVMSDLRSGLIVWMEHSSAGSSRDASSPSGGGARNSEVLG